MIDKELLIKNDDGANIPIIRMRMNVKCDGWRGDGNTGERIMCVEAVTKIKGQKNKLEIYSLAGAASCSSLASDGLSAEVNNSVIQVMVVHNNTLT